MSELVVKGTPWEIYDINGIPVYVKREDLCCPPPGPSFSKIRGVEMMLKGMEPGTPIGVLDTYHSKAGWGVAWICHALGLSCYNFYPVYKRECINGFDLYSHELRPNQQRCLKLGAQLRPLAAGRSAILYHHATAALGRATGDRGIMMPNGLKLYETVDATAAEVEEFTPTELLRGTWVVSVSSGTICAGVLQALVYEDVDVVAHMGYSRSEDKARAYMLDMACLKSFDREDVIDEIANRLDIVDEGYAYKDGISYPCPFPCNEYYDLKAWKWLTDNVTRLRQPIVFWNIGS